MPKMPFMKCGHTAMAIDTRTKKPCCVICLGDPEAKIVDESPPDLTNRQARCSHYNTCKRQVPSSIDLAFFEYKGPNSKYAENVCHVCGYYTKTGNFQADGKLCYSNSDKAMPDVCINNGKECVYEPYKYDKYYCGCKGWN